MACHKLARIGMRTASGAPMAGRAGAVGFHQSLIQPDCMACHSDHSGPRLVNASKPGFAHTLLRTDLRNQCASCHRAPQTPLHAQAGNNCAACHSQAGWKPATFDHARLFSLTGPHQVQGQTICATCHIGGDVGRYTCFGCHQHQPEQIRHCSGSGEGGESRAGRRREGSDDD